MLLIQQTKQIGNTKLYEIKINDKNIIKIYITEKELMDVILFYKDMNEQYQIECDFLKLPIQGQMFLILNNIMDFRSVNNTVLSELVNNSKVDELQSINQIILQKMNGYLTKCISDTLSIESNNRFIILQKNILLFQLYSQIQQYEKSFEVLQYEIKSLKADENKGRHLFYLFNFYINSSQILSLHGQREEALQNLQQAVSLLSKLFIEEELELYKCVVQINKANIKQDMFEFEDVKKILNQCLNNLNKIKNSFPQKIQRLMAQVHNNLSTCYQQEGDELLDKSLEHSLISLQMNELYFENSMNSEVAKNLMNISSIYKDLSMIDQSLAYALKAEQIFSQIQDNENYPICLGMISQIYQEVGQQNLKKALEYSLKCVELLEKFGKKNTIDFAVAQYGLSCVYNCLNQNEDALKYASLALTQLQEMKEEHYQIKCFEQLSKIYKCLDNLDLAIDNLYDAIQIREKVEKDDPTEELFLAYSNIAFLWEEKGDNQESKYYSNKAKKLEVLLKQYDD